MQGNNIYIDSSFVQPVEGRGSVIQSIEFVLPDNIGNYEMPIIYQVGGSVSDTLSNSAEYTVVDTISGIRYMPISFFREITMNEDVMVSLVNYSINNSLSGTIDSDIFYSTGYNPISGSLNGKVNFIAGQKYGSFSPNLIEYTTTNFIGDTDDYWTNYTNYCGHSNVEGYPIPSLSGYKDPIVEYGVGDYTLGGRATDVDITFAGWVAFPFLTEVYSVDAGVIAPYQFSVTTISGNIVPVPVSVYSSVQTLSGTTMDVYCSLLDMAQIDTDVELIKGRFGYTIGDVYSTDVDTQKLTCAFDLYSLKITNFSLDIDEYSIASRYISVDVLDDIYGVSISGTYFKVADQIVPVTFSGIEEGYRMFYTPLDGFSSLIGATVFTVHAENLNNDVLEEDFYLTFGYLVTHNNYPRFGLDYDYNRKVIVRVTAENMASCPKESADSNYFITEKRKNVDLGASITGMFHAHAKNNLSMEVYPQSLAYFYGKEFEVTIKAKDFSGNDMVPYILKYKIEDKPD